MGTRVEIVDGRHPVLEQTLVEERFVPNDTLLDNREQQLLIITGPNMAGKSTYIRQGCAAGIDETGQLVHSGDAGDGRTGGPDFHACLARPLPTISRAAETRSWSR